LRNSENPRSIGILME